MSSIQSMKNNESIDEVDVEEDEAAKIAELKAKMVRSNKAPEKQEVMDLFRTNEAKSAGNRPSPATTMLTQNYEQISVKEIISRVREKTTVRRKSFTEKDLVAVEEAETFAEYHLEAPKSGLLTREEVLQPMFLPTRCEMGPITDPGSSAIDYTALARLPEVRNLIYCSDAKVLSTYKKQIGSNTAKANKTHWGLTFDANFEGGNLYQVESVLRKGAPLGTPEEYDLFLHTDISCHPQLHPAHAQYFLFRIQNTKRRKYRFNIHFLTKPNSSFKNGLKPVMLSETAFSQDKIGWRNIGEDIVYSESTQRPLCSSYSPFLPDLDMSMSTKRYCLSFTYSMDYAKDTLYLSSSLPYFYTQLQNMIYVLSKNPLTRPHLHVRSLCRSLAGNRVDLLVISEKGKLIRSDMDGVDEGSNGEKGDSYSLKDVLPDSITANILPSSPSNPAAAAAAATGESSEVPSFLRKLQSQMNQQTESERRKKVEKGRKAAIIIFARIHPGETCSSWICEGIIKFLLGDSPAAKKVREHFVFYIVPMVNPDGVINGMTRNDICGYDLQYQWALPSSTLHPVIASLKALITNINNTTSIAGFFDLRGHTGKEGIFFHSLLTKATPNMPVRPETNPFAKDPRLFFYAMAKRSKLISLKHCSLVLPPHKSTSAKAIFHRQFNIKMSVSVEASLWKGPKGTVYQNRHLMPVDYAKFGSQLCLALIDLFLGETLLVTDSFMVSEKPKGLVDFQEILQHLPTIIDDEKHLSSTPFVTADRDISPSTRERLGSSQQRNRRRGSILASSGSFRSSFRIGSTDHDDSLLSQNNSFAINSNHPQQQLQIANGTKESHHFEQVDIDLMDIDHQADFNEDIWEERSNASSDGDYDQDDHNLTLKIEENQSGQVMHRSALRFLRRGQYLGLVAPSMSSQAKRSEKEEEEEALVQTEHVFRMQPNASSFYPIAVMVHSDRFHHLRPVPPAVDFTDSSVANDIDTTNANTNANTNAAVSRVNTSNVSRVASASSALGNNSSAPNTASSSKNSNVINFTFGLSSAQRNAVYFSEAVTATTPTDPLAQQSVTSTENSPVVLTSSQTLIKETIAATRGNLLLPNTTSADVNRDKEKDKKAGTANSKNRQTITSAATTSLPVAAHHQFKENDGDLVTSHSVAQVPRSSRASTNSSPRASTLRNNTSNSANKAAAVAAQQMKKNNSGGAAPRGARATITNQDSASRIVKRHDSIAEIKEEDIADNKAIENMLEIPAIELPAIVPKIEAKVLAKDVNETALNIIRHRSQSLVNSVAVIDTAIAVLVESNLAKSDQQQEMAVEEKITVPVAALNVSQKNVQFVPFTSDEPNNKVVSAPAEIIVQPASAEVIVVEDVPKVAPTAVTVAVVPAIVEAAPVVAAPAAAAAAGAAAAGSQNISPRPPSKPNPLLLVSHDATKNDPNANKWKVPSPTAPRGRVKRATRSSFFDDHFVDATIDNSAALLDSRGNVVFDDESDLDDDPTDRPLTVELEVEDDNSSIDPAFKQALALARTRYFNLQTLTLGDNEQAATQPLDANNSELINDGDGANSVLSSLHSPSLFEHRFYDRPPPPAVDPSAGHVPIIRDIQTVYKTTHVTTSTDFEGKGLPPVFVNEEGHVIRFLGEPLTQEETQRQQTQILQQQQEERQERAKTKIELKLQAQQQFAKDMGLDYDYLFGMDGIMALSPWPVGHPLHEDTDTVTAASGDEKKKYVHYPAGSKFKPSGPQEGLEHRQFPARQRQLFVGHGVTTKMGEVQWQPQQAIYRLYLYYEHVVDELKRRKVVPDEEIDRTARQLVEQMHGEHHRSLPPRQMLQPYRRHRHHHHGHRHRHHSNSHGHHSGHQHKHTLHPQPPPDAPYQTQQQSAEQQQMQNFDAASSSSSSIVSFNQEQQLERHRRISAIHYAAIPSKVKQQLLEAEAEKQRHLDEEFAKQQAKEHYEEIMQARLKKVQQLSWERGKHETKNLASWVPPQFRDLLASENHNKAKEAESKLNDDGNGNLRAWLRELVQKQRVEEMSGMDAMDEEAHDQLDFTDEGINDKKDESNVADSDDNAVRAASPPAISMLTHQQAQPPPRRVLAHELSVFPVKDDRNTFHSLHSAEFPMLEARRTAVLRNLQQRRGLTGTSAPRSNNSSSSKNNVKDKEKELLYLTGGRDFSLLAIDTKASSAGLNNTFPLKLSPVNGEDKMFDSHYSDDSLYVDYTAAVTGGGDMHEEHVRTIQELTGNYAPPQLQPAEPASILQEAKPTLWQKLLQPKKPAQPKPSKQPLLVAEPLRRKISTERNLGGKEKTNRKSKSANVA